MHLQHHLTIQIQPRFCFGNIQNVCKKITTDVMLGEANPKEELQTMELYLLLSTPFYKTKPLSHYSCFEEKSLNKFLKCKHLS